MTNSTEIKIRKFINLAKMYGYAARVLDEKIEWQRTNFIPGDHDAHSYLWVPSLHLSAHALECMLKACAHLNNIEPPAFGKKGHDINSMLRQDYAQKMRDRIFLNAEKAAQRLRIDPAFAHLDLSDPSGWMNGALQTLGKLHLEDGSKLRYLSHDPLEPAPSSPLLAEAIYLTTQDLGKDRDKFKINPSS